MSKRKKHKFRHQQPAGQPGFPSGQASSSSTSAATYSAPAYAGGTPSNAVIADVHAAEYRVIRHDLIKVVILNALFLAGVLALYYTNQNSHYLERWFGSILHF